MRVGSSSGLRTSVVVWLICVFALSTPGCSLFAGSRTYLTVTASESSAEIWIDGAMYGSGTAQADVARDKPHAIMVKAGDRVATRTVARTISTTGILDIIGGLIWLFPFLGLLGSGFWDLEEEHVNVVLPQRGSN